MKTVSIIQARFESKRLPGKVLLDLGNIKVLDWVYRAASKIIGVDEVVVAISKDKTDDVIEKHCKKNNYLFFRGEKEDVLSRFYNAAKKFNADRIVRVTADCPFLDPRVCSEVILLYDNQNSDYASNTGLETWPDGLDCEVIKFKVLKEAHFKAFLPSDREHATPWIKANNYKFNIANLICPYKNFSKFRWTLDRYVDYKLMEKIVKVFSSKKVINYIELSNFLLKNPRILKINSAILRNEGLKKSNLGNNNSKLFSNKKFINSNKLFLKAKKFIPLASQTFSKSYINWPAKQTPLFLTHGLGGRVWDVDGNEYVDLVGGLASVILGYCDEDVDYAIKNQLNKGITFSLANELEIKLSKKLNEHVSTAEQTRFGKNGTDVTSAAIRLARYFTKRDRIIVCGYHGWQDWYIGTTTRDKGVPKSVKELTNVFKFNSITSLEKIYHKYPNQIAAVILEPMTFEDPKNKFLKEVKRIVKNKKSLLIFDEIVTGFRFGLGGAQKYFDVEPDISCFGKSMGNGMPIAAITGKKNIMKNLEEIFFSGTFGGETLSLSASLAVIDKMERLPVAKHLWNYGKKLKTEVNKLIKSFKLEDTIKIEGKSPWAFVNFKDTSSYNKFQIITFFKKMMIKYGVLVTGTHNICYAHNEHDLKITLHAYKETLSLLSQSIKKKNLEKFIKDCSLVKPIFTVRNA